METHTSSAPHATGRDGTEQSPEAARGIAVSLAWYEVLQGASVGVMRRVESMRSTLLNAHGCPNTDAWTKDVEGALAELAFAKVIKRYWNGSVNTFKEADVEGGWQVRWSPHPGSSLIVRPRDRDEDRFVLVVGSAPEYRVVGWMRGAEAKREAWKMAPNDRAPAYFVPQAALTRITTS